MSHLCDALVCEANMASPYGTVPRPKAPVGTLTAILPLEKKLKDSTIARVLHISQGDEQGSTFAPRFPKLVSRMHTLFNAEIEDGNTYPQEELLHEAQFRAYFLGYDAFVVLQGKSGSQIDLDDGTVDWAAELLGFFYVKPNFPGRCSHVRFPFPVSSYDIQRRLTLLCDCRIGCFSMFHVSSCDI